MPEHRGHLKGVRPPRPRIVIAGGGVAAIEALLALRHIVGEQVSITAARARAQLRPPSVVRGRAVRLRRSRAASTSPRSRATRARSCGAEPSTRSSPHVTPSSTGGEDLPYDVLVVAVGAIPSARRARRADVRRARPGRPTSPRSSTESSDASSVVSSSRSPPESTWSLPVYELAMMAAVDLRDRGVTDATLGVVTPEPEPLRLFGPAAGVAMREMLDARGISLWTGARPLGLRDGTARRRARATAAR